MLTESAGIKCQDAGSLGQDFREMLASQSQADAGGDGEVV